MAARAAYVLALAHHVFASAYVLFFMDFSGASPADVYVHNMQVYNPRFLTTWNMAVQTLYLSLSVLEDFLPRLTWVDPKLLYQLQKPLTRARNYIFGSVVFPLGIFVALVFWGLFALDRELVLPRAADAVMPAWLNHCVHTDVAVVVAMAALLRPHRYASRTGGLCGLLLFMLVYNTVLVWTYLESGHWLYPVFDRLGSCTNKVLLFLLASLATSSLYIVGEHLNRIIWGS